MLSNALDILAHKLKRLPQKLQFVMINPKTTTVLRIEEALLRVKPNAI